VSMDRERAAAGGPRGPARSAGPGSDDWVERVRTASDLVEIVSQTVPLKRVGRNLMGRCPFHEEKSASFSVSPERQFYHCFGCKAGGDVFKYVQETEKVGFLEAVELLSRRAGIPIPERRAGERSRRAPILEALDAAATAFEQWLGDPKVGEAPRAYLDSRGIGRDMQREFRLGWAPPGWESLVGRLRGQFNDDVLVEARLAGRREGGRGIFDWFRNRLIVPLVAPGGAVIGFGARAFGDETPKYLNSPESAVYHKGQFLFALEQARKNVKPEGEVVVVEGYFDAIALHQAGVRNTVATSGTALTEEHAKTLRRLARTVALTYDGDAAGQQAMLRSLAVLLAEGLDVAIVDLPPGDDPDTLVRRAGVAGWCNVRDSAYEPMEFVHRHVLRTSTGGDPRERALQVVVRLLAGVDDPVRLQGLVQRAAQVLGRSLSLRSGVDEQTIAQAVRLARKTSQRATQSTQSPSNPVQSQGRAGQLERRLLLGLWHAPAQLESARAELQVDDFEDAGARALAGLWWEQGIVLPEGDGAAAVLARELAAAPVAGDPAEETLGAIRKLVIRRWERERRELQAQLETARGDDAPRLLREIQDIGQTLKQLSAGH